VNGNAAWRQFLPMVCLLVVVGAGAEARTTLSSHRATISLTTPFTVLVAVAWTASAVLIVSALLRSIAWRRRRAAEDQQPVVEIPQSWFARAVAVVACLALLVIPVVLLVTAPRHHPAAPGMPRTSITSTAAHPRHAPATRSAAHGPSMVELIGLAVAAIAAAGAPMAIRRRQHTEMSAAQSDGPEAMPADVVAATVRRGGAAMFGIPDARAAIIACYTAMETQLAGTGLARGRSQTPSELLHAAVRDGIVAPEPAARLTRLFERARFGDDPMTHIDRGTAEDALAHLDPRRHPHRVRP
jgi:lysylphosphatidylglycerol synthetase-like protein (DUF2156 family)